MTTGEIEVVASSFEVLNKAIDLPFMQGKKVESISDDVRYRYRYLDLRREFLQKNIRFRSNLSHFIRSDLLEQGMRSCCW